MFKRCFSIERNGEKKEGEQIEDDIEIIRLNSLQDDFFVQINLNESNEQSNRVSLISFLFLRQNLFFRLLV